MKKKIAVFTTGWGSEILSQFLTGMENELKNEQFDGTVIFASGLDYQDRIDNIIERSNEAGIPVIIQGNRREGISYVGSDNNQAIRDLCAHVRDEHGAKTISFIAGTKDSHDSELRVEAVRNYLKENNCEDDLVEVFYTDWENAAVTRHIKELCESGEKLPDVFICANDGLAMETCISLSNNGYEVPNSRKTLERYDQRR